MGAEIHPTAADFFPGWEIPQEYRMTLLASLLRCYSIAAFLHTTDILAGAALKVPAVFVVLLRDINNNNIIIKYS